jgi:integrase
MTPPRPPLPTPDDALTQREEIPAATTALAPNTALAPRPAGAGLVPAADFRLPEHLRGAAAATMAAAWAPGTQKVYTDRWADFVRWCDMMSRQALPAAPASVVAYLLDRAGALSLSVLEQTHAAIAWMHKGHGYDPPPTAAEAVKTTMKGLRRQKGRRAVKAKDPITVTELRDMLAGVNRLTLSGKRDAALLLVGWNCALRRSELAALCREHLRDEPGGASVLIERSKTDQEGQGARVGFPQRDEEPALCPMRAVNALLAGLREKGITTGPLFRPIDRHGNVGARPITGESVAEIVKKYAGRAGLPEEPFAGHSLRAGFVTEAYRQDAPEAAIMAQTRHASTTMLARYRREADPVKRGAASALTMKGRKKP